MTSRAAGRPGRQAVFPEVIASVPVRASTAAPRAAPSAESAACEGGAPDALPRFAGDWVLVLMRRTKYQMINATMTSAMMPPREPLPPPPPPNVELAEWPALELWVDPECPPPPARPNAAPAATIAAMPKAPRPLGTRDVN